VPPLIPHFSTLVPDYDALLCDVWGVVHNGLTAYPHACDALMRARARGATVVLITNAPRQSEVVARQLDKLHVPVETYDGIVSSGDVTRAVIEARPGQSVCHIGPERDRSIFTGVDVRLAPLERADYVVCSGLDDDDRVVTMTFSEFGRRVEENANRGTDHGTAAPMFIIGGGVSRIFLSEASSKMRFAFATFGRSNNSKNR